MPLSLECRRLALGPIRLLPAPLSTAGHPPLPLSTLRRHLLRPRAPVAEPLVIDGLESFAYSQDHPLHLNLAVGADSHFVYAFTHAELRRKGTMRADQPRPLGMARWLAERLFPTRVGLPAPWREYYRREVPTAPIANPRRHQLKLAF